MGRGAADLRCDVTALPFASESVDRLAAIHLLEHLYEWEAIPALAEWKRVLKVGGQLILELPSMEKVLWYIKQCLDAKVPLQPAFSWWVFWGDPVHRDPRMTHRWGYTKETLTRVLSAAGFYRTQFEAPRYHFRERDMRCVAVKGG